jgi:DNA-directed RNA polymerase specialized sigma24 family protein
MTVAEMLGNYHELKRTLGILEFKIENYEMYRISKERTIEEMTYATPRGERVTTSGISDKTARIALKYESVTEANNDEHLEYLENVYKAKRFELEMLDRSIALLPKEQSEIVVDFAINGISQRDLSVKYNMSRSTIARQYESALVEIEKTYQDLTHGVAV